MKYYLVTTSTIFVDPHGDVDFGGFVKSVEHTDRFEGLDLDLTYNDDLEEVDEDSYSSNEDGYNSSYDELDIKEITKEEYIRFGAIIEEYNKMGS